MSSFDFSYECTAPLADAILRREFLKRLVALLGISAILAAVALILVGQSEFSWLGGWIYGILVGSTTSWGVLLAKLYQSSSNGLKAYVGHQISIHLDERGLRITSPLQDSQCPWWAVISVKESPQALFLTRRGALGQVILPLEVLSEEAVAFVKTSVSGAKLPSK